MAKYWRGSFVYLVNLGPFPELVKVGHANRVKYRMGELQTGNPFEIQLLATRNVCCGRCASACENAIHRVLSGMGYHEGLEWFRLDQSIRQQLIEFIEKGTWPSGHWSGNAERVASLLSPVA